MAVSQIYKVEVNFYLILKLNMVIINLEEQRFNLKKEMYAL